MALRRTKTDLRKDAICHNCKEHTSTDAASYRSLNWAFGLVGVRWIVCSPTCARDCPAT